MSARNSRNTIIITDQSQIPNIASVYTFAANTTYQISGSVAFSVSAGVTQLVMGDGTIIQGNDPTVDKLIIQANLGNVITGTDKSVSFYNLGITFNALGTQALFALTGTGLYNFNMKGCNIDFAGTSTRSLGTISGFLNARVENNFFTKLDQGFTFSGTSKELVFNNNISNLNNNLAAFKLINIPSGTFNNIAIHGNSFNAQINENVITVGAITLNNTGRILDNSFYGAGTYLTGVSSVTPNWLITSNAYLLYKFITIGNTPISAQSIPIPTNSTMLIEVRATARKTAGTGPGVVGNSNGYIRTVKAKNIAGVVTIGTIQSDFTSEDIIPGNMSFSVLGTNVNIQVTGTGVGINANTMEWIITTNIN